jgi:hypothetical protein
MNNWIFGLSWLWFFSLEKVFNVKWKMEKKIKANLDQKLKFSFKQRKWQWNHWGLLGCLESYPIRLVLFSIQFSKSFKFRNRAEPPMKIELYVFGETPYCGNAFDTTASCHWLKKIIKFTNHLTSSFVYGRPQSKPFYECLCKINFSAYCY